MLSSLIIIPNLTHLTPSPSTPDSPSLPLSNIKAPLRPHPDQTPIRHDHRPRQRSSPFRSPKHKPFAHKMHPRNAIRQNRHLVDLRIVDVVGGIETNDRLDECPGAEGARLKGRHGAIGSKRGCWVGFGDGGRGGVFRVNSGGIGQG